MATHQKVWSGTETNANKSVIVSPNNIATHLTNMAKANRDKPVEESVKKERHKCKLAPHSG